MTRARLRVGVVGLGRMGRLHLANLARLGDRAALAGLCDARKEVASAEAESRGAPGFTELAALLETARPDAVIITTPTAAHARQIAEAASGRVAIFCEKPVALTLEEARDVAGAVGAAGVPFQIGFQRRFDPAYREAWRRIADGAIGEPITFKAVARDAGQPSLEFARVESSGGLFVDMAIHDFDLARWLMASEVRRVSAEGSSLLYPELRTVGDVDNGVCNCTFASGAIGNIEASRTGTWGYDIRTEVVGTRGALFIGPTGETGLAQAGPGGFARRAVAGFEERFRDAYQAELDHFLECVAAGREPACGMADAVRALEAALAARRSFETRQPVEVAAAAVA